MRDLHAVCSKCGEQFAVPLAAIDLPGDTPLKAVPTLRPIACAKCSAPADVDIHAMGLDPK